MVLANKFNKYNQSYSNLQYDKLFYLINTVWFSDKNPSLHAPKHEQSFCQFPVAGNTTVHERSILSKNEFDDKPSSYTCSQNYDGCRCKVVMLFKHPEFFIPIKPDSYTPILLTNPIILVAFT